MGDLVLLELSDLRLVQFGLWYVEILAVGKQVKVSVHACRRIERTPCRRQRCDLSTNLIVLVLLSFPGTAQEWSVDNDRGEIVVVCKREGGNVKAALRTK